MTGIALDVRDINFTAVQTVDEALMVLNVSLEELTEYYVRVAEVMNEMIALTPFDPKRSKGYWCSGPNPFYNQLDLRGDVLALAMIEYYGDPSCLATPLGGITFGTGGISKDGWWETLKKFELKPLWGEHYTSPEHLGKESEQRAVYIERVGEFGPVWSVNKDSKGKEFGKAAFNPDYVGIPSMQHRNHLPYEVVKKLWEMVKPEQYQSI